MTKLEIKNLTVSFVNKKEKTVAVDNLSLTVNDGDFVVILGASGCGKTTLLRTIGGLLDYEDGDMFFGNTNALDLTVKQRNLSYVTQSFTLYPHLTVFDNIAYPLKAARVPFPEIEKRVNEVAILLGILPFLTRLPRHLSGGQQQRVAIARSIAKRPEIYLFDEPFSNLDAKARTELRQELKRIHTLLGSTVIFVTHDQSEAMYLATKLVVMNKGKIVQIGEPIEVYNNPTNEIVRSILIPAEK